MRLAVAVGSFRLDFIRQELSFHSGRAPEHSFIDIGEFDAI